MRVVPHLRTCALQGDLRRATEPVELPRRGEDPFRIEQTTSCTQGDGALVEGRGPDDLREPHALQVPGRDVRGSAGPAPPSGSGALADAACPRRHAFVKGLPRRVQAAVANACMRFAGMAAFRGEERLLRKVAAHLHHRRGPATPCFEHRLLRCP